MVDVEGLIKSIQNDWHVSENEANFVLAALKVAVASCEFEDGLVTGLLPEEHHRRSNNKNKAYAEFARLYNKKEVENDVR